MGRQGIIIMSQKHQVTRTLDQMSENMENFKLQRRILNRVFPTAAARWTLGPL